MKYVKVLSPICDFSHGPSSLYFGVNFVTGECTINYAGATTPLCLSVLLSAPDVTNFFLSKGADKSTKIFTPSSIGEYRYLTALDLANEMYDRYLKMVENQGQTPDLAIKIAAAFRNIVILNQ